jgi:hypothetical protein
MRDGKEKEVADGEKYLEDEDGNLVKDSLGNPVKVTRYKTITAHVTEVHQEKRAIIEGDVDFRETYNDELIKTEQVTAEAIFNHSFAKAYGDLEALSDETRHKLKQDAVPFPNDEELLHQAQKDMKKAVKSVLWNNDHLLTP